MKWWFTGEQDGHLAMYQQARCLDLEGESLPFTPSTCLAISRLTSSMFPAGATEIKGED